MSNPGRQSLMVPSAVTPRASMSLSPDLSDLRKTKQSVILIFPIVHCPIIIPTKEKLKGSWLFTTDDSSTYSRAAVKSLVFSCFAIGWRVSHDMS